MNQRFSIIICTLLLSIPMILKIPGLLPFLQSDVRAAAPEAMDQLRSEGIWLVNVSLQSIQESEEEICFEWKHRYRSRLKTEDPQTITTCIQ